MKKSLIYLSILALGVGAGVMGNRLYLESVDVVEVAASDQPLYWVAPMDPNYQRDKPGKSPMGMDLVPVYAEESSDSGEGPGTVKISPEVVNNLGVRTASVESAAFDATITTVGYVQYDEDKLVHIHPRVEGWIEKLYIKAEGDPVKKGQILYDIYSPMLVNAQEELVLALNRSNDRLVGAAIERLRALQVSGSVIKQLKRTKKVRQSLPVYAPQSGIIDNLNVREGFFVKPGVTVMSIGLLDDVWVVGEIYERQAALVNEGDAVTMSLQYAPGRLWKGKIDYVYPTLDEKTRTARVRVRVDNADRQLKPNMFTHMIIESRNSQPALVIPREALIRTGEQNRVVLALGEGQFKSVEVTVGRLGSDQVEILNGVNEGEKIVTSAQFLIDSESSKTSDFRRMNNETESIETPQTVWVEGVVKSVMEGHRMVTLNHKAIEQWDWPAMTMDFTVDSKVEMGAFIQEKSLHVEISKLDEDNYSITQIHIPDSSSETLPGASGASPSDEHEEMDHSQHKAMSESSDHSGH